MAAPRVDSEPKDKPQDLVEAAIKTLQAKGLPISVATVVGSGLVPNVGAPAIRRIVDTWKESQQQANRSLLLRVAGNAGLAPVAPQPASAPSSPPPAEPAVPAPEPAPASAAAPEPQHAAEPRRRGRPRKTAAPAEAALALPEPPPAPAATISSPPPLPAPEANPAAEPLPVAPPETENLGYSEDEIAERLFNDGIEPNVTTAPSAPAPEAPALSSTPETAPPVSGNAMPAGDAAALQAEVIRLRALLDAAREENGRLLELVRAAILKPQGR